MMKKSFYEQVVEKEEIIKTLREVIREDENEILRLKNDKEILIKYIKEAFENDYMPIGLYANLMKMLGEEIEC